MDSKKVKLYKMFAILVLPIYFRSAATTNIDCGGKPFHCVNSTHFMICVDLGAGVSKTVDDFAIQCPPTTVCRDNNYFECEFQLTTTQTIHSTDETNDYTTDTALPNRFTNMIDFDDKTSVTRLLEEYTTDDTKADYAPDKQIYKDLEISGAPEILSNTNNNALTSSNQQKFLKVTIEPYKADNFPLNSRIAIQKGNNYSQLLTPLKKVKLFQHSISPLSTKFEKVTLEPLFAANTLNDNITIINIVNNANLTDDFSFKSIDNFYETTTETKRKDTSTLAIEENITTDFLNKANTFKELIPSLMHTNNSDMDINYFAENYITTQTTISNYTQTFYPKLKNNIYYANTSSVIINKKGLLPEKFFTLININKLKNTETTEQNIPETNLIQDKDNIKLNDTLLNVELTSELNVIEQTTLLNDMNILLPYGQNKLRITGKPKLTNFSFMSESTQIPTNLISDVKPRIISTTVSSKILSDNEISLLEYENKTEAELISTGLNSITTEYTVPDTYTLKPVIKEINFTTLFDYKLTSEISTEAPEVKFLETKLQEVVRKKIITSHANDINTLSPDYSPLEVNSTITTSKSDFAYNITSSSEHETNTPEYNSSASYEPHITELPFLGDIYLTRANNFNLLINAKLNLSNDDLTTSSISDTLDLTIEPVKHVTSKFDEIYSTTMSNADGNNNIILETSPTELDLLSIRLSESKKKLTNKINLESVFDTNNNKKKINESMSTTPGINVYDQSTEIMRSNGSRILSKTNEYNNLPTLEQSMQQIKPLKISANSYFDGTPLGIENKISKPNLNLKYQIISDKKVNTSSPQEEKFSDGFFSIDHTSIANTYNLSVTKNFFLPNYDSTTLSMTKQEHEEEMIKRKEVIEHVTISYTNENENGTYSLQYEIATEPFQEKAIYASLDYDVSSTEKLAINETILTFEYENSTFKPDIKAITEEVQFDTNVERTKYLKFKNNNINITSQNYNKTVKATVTPGLNFPISVENISSNKNTNASTSIQSEFMEITTSNRISEFEIDDTLLIESQQTNMSSNVTTTPLMPVFMNFSSIENPIFNLNSANSDSTPDLGDWLAITTEVTNIDNVKNDVLAVSTLPNNKSNKIVLLKDKLREENIDKSSTTNTTNYKEKISTVTEINSVSKNTEATKEERRIQNQQVFNDNIRLTSQNQKTIETSVREGENLAYTEVLVTYDMIIPSTSKPLMTTTSMSNMQGKVHPEIIMEKDFNLLNRKIINDDATKSENKNFNKINDVKVQEKQDYNSQSHQIQDDVTKNSISNNSLVQLKLNLSDIPFGMAKNNSFANDNFNLIPININTENPFHNESIRIEKSNSVYNKTKTSLIQEVPLETVTPYKMSNIITKINRTALTSPNFTKSTHELHQKRNSSRINELNSTETINTTESIKYFSNFFPNIEPSLQNTRQINFRVPVKNIITSKMPHYEIPKTSIRDLRTPTTESYRPPVPVLLENLTQSSLYSKLNQILQRRGPDINSRQESNYQRKAINITGEDVNTPAIQNVSPIAKEGNLATTNPVKRESSNPTNIDRKIKHSYATSSLIVCNNRLRGRFADRDDCRKYYICIGKNQPVFGQCPTNTVFSELKKQCTKNLSHCIRNKQFQCIQGGRFSDVFRTNIYYICVNYNSSYIRFQFQCQNGFHLNKTSVMCVNNIKSRSQITSMSIDSGSNKASDQSTNEHKSKERKPKDVNHICKKEGKFPDDEDCRRYYVCSKNSKTIFRRKIKKCDSDEVFHREKKKCVDRDSYECS